MEKTCPYVVTMLYLSFRNLFDIRNPVSGTTWFSYLNSFKDKQYKKELASLITVAVHGNNIIVDQPGIRFFSSSYTIGADAKTLFLIMMYRKELEIDLELVKGLCIATKDTALYQCVNHFINKGEVYLGKLTEKQYRKALF